MNEGTKSAPTTDMVSDVPFPSWEDWNRIRNGPCMPCIEADRAEYASQRQFAAAHVTHTACVACKQRFSGDNCFTQAGWQETQISGLCERCFDAATAEPKEQVCPDCGRIIDKDMEGFDDVSSAPYVCEASDLHCVPCGRRCSEGISRDDEDNNFGDNDPCEERDDGIAF